jgi:hypothetical protein
MGQRLRFRGLFRKYFLVLSLAVVVPLAGNGVSEGVAQPSSLTVAISGNRPSVGVVVAEVNLKLIRDLVIE